MPIKLVAMLLLLATQQCEAPSRMSCTLVLLLLLLLQMMRRKWGNRNVVVVLHAGSSFVVVHVMWCGLAEINVASGKNTICTFAAQPVSVGGSRGLGATAESEAG